MEEKIFVYNIPNLNGEGWGKFILTSRKGEGDLFSVTDYGNYSYSWYSTGKDDFRDFILRTDTSYLIDKLTYDCRSDANHLYVDETVKAMKDGIKEYYDNDNSERMQEDLELADGIECNYTLNRFYEYCHMQEPWYYEVRGYSPRARAMRDELLPRLQEAIRKELELERK